MADLKCSVMLLAQIWHQPLLEQSPITGESPFLRLDNFNPALRAAFRARLASMLHGLTPAGCCDERLLP
jgi:hypothetical protein